MRSTIALSFATLAAVLQPLAVHAAVHITSYADAPFTVNLPGGTHQLYGYGSTFEIDSDAELYSWTAYNGANCYVDAPAGVPSDWTQGFEMLHGDQFLYPCGWVGGVRVVCTGPESQCTMKQ